MVSRSQDFVALISAALAVLGAFGLSAAPALSADCPQVSAVYADTGNLYELRFSPLNSESAAASNRFKISVAKTNAVMDGYVMRSEDPDRSNGIVMFHCPDGDVTGADLDACTVWQGVIYGQDASGKLGNLPLEKDQASAAVVLAGFGPFLRSSSAWGEGKATVAPWDVMNFKECAS